MKIFAVGMNYPNSEGKPLRCKQNAADDNGGGGDSGDGDLRISFVTFENFLWQN